MISRGETGPVVQRRIKTGRVVTRRDQSCTNVTSRTKTGPDRTRPVPSRRMCARTLGIALSWDQQIASQAVTSVYLLLLLLQCCLTVAPKQTCKDKFACLKLLYESERKSIVKRAHKLTNKTLYPSNPLERQQVALVVNVLMRRDETFSAIVPVPPEFVQMFRLKTRRV